MSPKTVVRAGFGFFFDRVGQGLTLNTLRQNGIVQQEAPADMRGRLLALGAVAFLGSTPVGAPITGLIADHVSAPWSLGYGSIIALVACAIGWVSRERAGRSMSQPSQPSATLAG